MTINMEKCRALIVPVLLIAIALCLVAVDIYAQGDLQPLSRSSTDVQATLDRGLDRANAYAPYAAFGGYVGAGLLAMNPGRRAPAAWVATGATIVAAVWTLYNGGRWLTGN